MSNTINVRHVDAAFEEFFREEILERNEVFIYWVRRLSVVDVYAPISAFISQSYKSENFV